MKIHIYFFKIRSIICPQHNLSVNADVLPGGITPFILFTALHPFFLQKHEREKNINALLKPSAWTLNADKYSIKL